MHTRIRCRHDFGLLAVSLIMGILIANPSRFANGTLNDRERLAVVSRIFPSKSLDEKDTQRKLTSRSHRNRNRANDLSR